LCENVERESLNCRLAAASLCYFCLEFMREETFCDQYDRMEIKHRACTV